MADPIRLPTRNGHIDIFEHRGSAECSAGCGAKGGGMARFEADGHRFAFCGNCLALSLVARIDALAASLPEGGEER